MARRRNKGDERRIAAGRIEALLALARREALGPDPALADRYAALARRVGMRHQVPLGAEGKAAVCRACGTFRVPDRTSRTRIRRGRVVTTCLVCGAVRRRPIGPKTAGQAHHEQRARQGGRA